jgi:hypothetical protein
MTPCQVLSILVRKLARGEFALMHTHGVHERLRLLKKQTLMPC